MMLRRLCFLFICLFLLRVGAGVPAWAQGWPYTDNEEASSPNADEGSAFMNEEDYSGEDYSAEDASMSADEEDGSTDEDTIHLNDVPAPVSNEEIAEPAAEPTEAAASEESAPATEEKQEAASDESSSDEITSSEIYMVKGELVTVKADGLTRISVTDPSVADIVKAENDRILLVGRGVGQTTLFVWDANGKQEKNVYVFAQDLARVKARIENLFAAADIHEAKLEISDQEGKVLVSGEIPEYKQEAFEQIVEKFSDSVINLTQKEEISDLIQIDVQITELSTTLSKSLGIEWTTGTNTGGSSALSTSSNGNFTPTYGEIFPTDLNGSLKDYVRLGNAVRTVDSALIAKVNALVEQGKARILSKPKLVVKNGEEASFLVGGEIPIRTTTSTQAGGTQENVSFKEYGISMTITPKIKRDDKIDINLSVEVSDVDSANAVGNDVAFTTRTAQTQLYLDDRETIVLAGLIRHSKSETLKKIPFLGDIPLVGALFRNRSTPTANQDQELVISLTPTVIAKNRNDEGEAQAQAVTPPAVVPTAAVAPPPVLPGIGQPAVSSSLSSPVAAPAVKQASVEPSSAKAMPAPAAPTPPLRVSISAMPAAAGIPQEMESYVRTIQQRIAQSIQYPEEARQHGWEGTVKLGLLILKDGTLATALVKESSGYEIFDEYALNTARSMAPYSSFPSATSLKQLDVTIPIVYRLGKN